MSKRLSPFFGMAWVELRFSLLFFATVCLSPGSALTAELTPDRWEEVFRVPDTDNVEQLLSQLSKMDEFQPQTAADWMTFRERGMPAMKNLAQKILRLKEDTKKSDEYQTAKYTLLAIRVFEVTDASPDEQEATIEIIKKVIGAPIVTDDDLDLAVALCSNLEAIRESTVAARAYEELGDILSQKEDPAIQQLGKRFLGSARRIGLVGNEMQISGKTIDGKEFRWDDYRGQVVLVDFWATWCGVCVQEMPRLRELYATYHPRGFEVVGISGDRDPKKLAAFIKSQSLPWVNLQADDGRSNPTAEYYGIFAYPTTMLVDRDGKVVTLEARGKTLEHWLSKLMDEVADVDERDELNVGNEVAELDELDKLDELDELDDVDELTEQSATELVQPNSVLPELEAGRGAANPLR